MIDNEPDIKHTHMLRRIFLLLILFAGSAAPVFGQHVGIKTNLLYDATSTLNLGVEVGLSRRITLELSGNLNPWTFSENRKMKHILLQPELRWWLCERFNGHFFGIHAHWAHYNWGGMLPWGFSNGKMFGVIENRAMMDNRYQGWLVGGGLTYGYQWLLGKHWNLEASLGLGYAYLKYDKYPCRKCGKKTDEEHKNYLGPTKAAVSLIYLF